MTRKKITLYAEAIKYIDSLKTKYNTIFSKFSYELLDNKELVIYALQNKYCSCNIKKISNRLKNDYDVAKLLIINYPFNILNLGDKFKNNEELILLAIKDNENILYELINTNINPLKLTNNFSITILKHNPKCIKYVDKSFKENIDIMLNIVKKDGELINYAHNSIINNDLLISSAINNTSKAIKFINQDKQTPEMIIKVLSSSYRNSLINYIKPEFLTNQDIILKALDYNTKLFVNLQNYKKLDKLIDNFDYYIKKHLKEDGNRLNNDLLTFLLEKYTNEQIKIIILKTHITRWSLYNELSNELKNDEEIILKFVLINKLAYKYVPKSITNIYDVKKFINNMKAYYGNIYIKEQGKKIKNWSHMDINFRF